MTFDLFIHLFHAHSTIVTYKFDLGIYRAVSRTHHAPRASEALGGQIEVINAVALKKMDLSIFRALWTIEWVKSDLLEAQRIEIRDSDPRISMSAVAIKP